MSKARQHFGRPQAILQNLRGRRERVIRGLRDKDHRIDVVARSSRAPASSFSAAAKHRSEQRQLRRRPAAKTDAGVFDDLLALLFGQDGVVRIGHDRLSAPPKRAPRSARVCSAARAIRRPLLELLRDHESVDVAQRVAAPSAPCRRPARRIRSRSSPAGRAERASPIAGSGDIACRA